MTSISSYNTFLVSYLLSSGSPRLDELQGTLCLGHEDHLVQVIHTVLKLDPRVPRPAYRPVGAS